MKAINEYLLSSTLQWIEQTLQRLNIDSIYYTAAEVLIDIDESCTHYTAYLSLQEVIKKHVLNKKNPILALWDAPREDKNWEPENCNIHMLKKATQGMKIEEEGSDESAKEENFIEDLDMALYKYKIFDNIGYNFTS